MSNPTFTVRVRGQEVTFTSAFARLDEAYKAVAAWVGEKRPAAGYHAPTEFADSLLHAARERRLTPSQTAWIHKLATDLQPVAALNLLPIVEMMQRAAAAQKRAPRIVLAIGDALSLADLAKGLVGRVVLTLGKKEPVRVFINDGRPYEQRTHYGYVHLDGSVNKYQGWKPEVEALLRRLAADPAAVAAQHGVATGTCCFCGTALSTAESRSVGYGPICASKFGLPWGDTAVADAADAEAKAAFGTLQSREGTALHAEVEKIMRDPSMIGPFVRKVSDCYEGEEN